jgi:hypothetical protein
MKNANFNLMKFDLLIISQACLGIIIIWVLLVDKTVLKAVTFSAPHWSLHKFFYFFNLVTGTNLTLCPIDHKKQLQLYHEIYKICLLIILIFISHFCFLVFWHVLRKNYFSKPFLFISRVLCKENNNFRGWTFKVSI